MKQNANQLPETELLQLLLPMVSAEPAPPTNEMLYELCIDQAFQIACQIDNQDLRGRAIAMLFACFIDAHLGQGIARDPNGIVFMMLVREYSSKLLGREISFSEVSEASGITLAEVAKFDFQPIDFKPAYRSQQAFYVATKHFIESLLKGQAGDLTKRSVVALVVSGLYKALLQTFPNKAEELIPLGRKVIYSSDSMSHNEAFGILLFSLANIEECTKEAEKRVTNAAMQENYRKFALENHWIQRIYWTVRMGKDVKPENRFSLLEYKGDRELMYKTMKGILEGESARQIATIACFIGEIIYVHEGKIPKELQEIIRLVLLKLADLPTHLFLMQSPINKQNRPATEVLTQCMINSVCVPDGKYSQPALINLLKLAKSIVQTISRQDFRSLAAKRHVLDLLVCWFEGLVDTGNAIKVDVNEFHMEFIPALEELIVFFETTALEEWDLRILRNFKHVFWLVLMKEQAFFNKVDFTEAVRKKYTDLERRWKICVRNYTARFSDRITPSSTYTSGIEEDKLFPPLEIQLRSEEIPLFIKMFLLGKVVGPSLRPTGRAGMMFSGPFLEYNTVPGALEAPDPGE